MRLTTSGKWMLFWVATLATPKAFATEPTLPTVDCSKVMRELDDKIKNDRRFATLKDALNSDPAERCQMNSRAEVDRRFATQVQEIASRNNARECAGSLCVATYQRMQALLAEYKEKLLAGCRLSAGAAAACSAASLPQGEAARFNCISAQLRKSADAEDAASKLVISAAEEAQNYRRLSIQASEIYVKDKAAITPFAVANDQGLNAARSIRGGRLETQNPSLLEELRSLDRTPTATRAAGATPSDITGAQVVARNGGTENLRQYYDRADRLAQEQTAASNAARDFNAFALEEGRIRSDSSKVLRDMALENERRATGQQTTPVTASSNTATNTTASSSAIPNLGNAAALAKNGAALAGAANQQSGASSAASSAGAGSMWSQVASAAQNLSGLGSSSSETTVNKLGGSTVGKSEKEKELPTVKPARREDLTQISSTGGDGTFVSGNGDLPALAGASQSSRNIAAAKSGKVGGGGVDISSNGKSKKDQSGAPACGSDKECMAAMGVESTQFNKAGSLGAPIMSAADSGSGSLASLDNLFGPLPTDPATAAPIGGGLLGAPGGGLDFNGGANGDNYTPASGVQAAAEMAPANSRSLFSRVRMAHEKALKRGSVSLFHKKL